MMLLLLWRTAEEEEEISTIAFDREKMMTGRLVLLVDGLWLDRTEEVNIGSEHHQWQ